MKPRRLYPFFKYFGSKNRLAGEYPKPLHDELREDFAGGAGFACNHYERQIVLADSDPRVARIWSFLIRASASDIMALPLLEPGQSIDSLDISEDARLFMSCCVNTSPFRRTLTSWKNGQNDGLWGRSWRERVAAQVEHIKHWEVHCRPYWESDNARCTRFVDPPYKALAENYSESRRNPIDYNHLATWCATRAGQVIVCEQSGADWLPFYYLGKAGAVRGSKSCEEAVWYVEDQPGRLCAPPKQRDQLALFG
jgi:site-specific DNA-adenine methylase